MDMEKLHDVNNIMHTFSIAYFDVFVPEGERQLLFSFFSTGCLITLKKIPLMVKKRLNSIYPFQTHCTHSKGKLKKK